MIFRQYFDEITNSYTYAFGDSGTREMVFVDTVKEHLDFYKREINKNGWKLRYLCETHLHEDHITAAGALHERFTESKILVSQNAPRSCFGVRVSDNRQLVVGQIVFEFLHTPGHSPESLCILVNGSRLLTGDTLHIGSIGHSFERNEAHASDHFRSLQRLKHLALDTLIYPGHDLNGRTVSTLIEELKQNVIFKCSDLNEFKAAQSEIDFSLFKQHKFASAANLNHGV